MFQGYDVRDVFPKISPESVTKIGAAFSNWAEGEPIVLGRDVRTTSLLLSKAFAAGAMAAGSEVTDLGIITTPMLAYGAMKTGSFGAMISASHNPPEFNGIKFVRKDGTDVSSEDLSKIENLSSSPSYSKWSKVGSQKAMSITESYIRELASKCELKVAIDSGNGATCGVARAIFEKTGCEVFEINAKPDGVFPGRGAEPKVDNLGALVNTVKTNHAAFGVAFDGDGDRAVFVDELGSPIRADYLLLLLGEGKKAVATVNLTSLLEKHLQVGRCKIGRTHITEKLRADPSFELAAEWSGHFWFTDKFLFSDGILAAVKLAKFLSEKSTPLSELISKFPTTHVHHTKVTCPHDQKLMVIGKLKEKFPDADTTDGVKLFFEDGWVLVRKSNTEPILRVSAEAASQKSAKSRAQKYADVVFSLVKG